MSQLFRVSLLLSTIVGLPVLLYFLGSNVLISAIGAGLGFIFVILYILAVILLLRWSPMWPKGGRAAGVGWTWVAASLIWGGGMSFFLVMVSGLPILSLTQKLGWDLVEASIGGAYPEEIAKLLGVGVILFSFRGLNRPWHGLMTGALVGLGFEAIENAMYGALGATLDANSDSDGALVIWGMRVIAGPGLHIVFSAMAGWGIGQAIFLAGRSTAWRWAIAGWWLFVAFALHFCWNLMWPTEQMLTINYLVVAAVMYPLFLWVWVRAHRMCVADDSYAFTQVAQRRLPTGGNLSVA